MGDQEESGGGASQSTEPAAGTSSATDVSLREYFWALRDADKRFHDERDRRYAELAIEREKALKIKETADLAALGLAREIQTYKDEKANELREQINAERGHYVSRDEYAIQFRSLEEALKPLNEFMIAQQGKSAGIGLSANVLGTLFGLLIFGVGVIISAYVATH